MKYTSASDAMLVHRYGPSASASYRSQIPLTGERRQVRRNLRHSGNYADTRVSPSELGMKISSPVRFGQISEQVTLDMFGDDDFDDEDEFGGFFNDLFSREGRVKRLRKRWLKTKKQLDAPSNEKQEARLEKKLERIEAKLEKLGVDTDDIEASREEAMKKAAAILAGDESMGFFYGTLPVSSQGAVELQPVVAAGVDTGTVRLAPLSPQPELTPGADAGIEMGFAEFMKEYGVPG